MIKNSVLWQLYYQLIPLVSFVVIILVLQTADYTIIMSRTPKITGNHVKFARFVLIPVSEEAKT